MHGGRAGTRRHRVWFTAADNASFSELEAFRNTAALQSACLHVSTHRLTAP